MARRAVRGWWRCATQPASSWPLRLSPWRRPLLFIVVAVTVADILACRPPCGNGKVGGAFSLWWRRGERGRGGGRAQRRWPPPGIGDCCCGAGLRPGPVDAIIILFEDGATGTDVFHGVGAGTGAGVDAIFGVFVDNLMCGADRAADASRAAANATAACAEILSSPPRPPTLQHSISATVPSS